MNLYRYTDKKRYIKIAVAAGTCSRATVSYTCTAIWFAVR